MCLSYLLPQYILGSVFSWVFLIDSIFSHVFQGGDWAGAYGIPPASLSLRLQNSCRFSSWICSGISYEFFWGGIRNSLGIVILLVIPIVPIAIAIILCLCCYSIYVSLLPIKTVHYSIWLCWVPLLTSEFLKDKESHCFVCLFSYGRHHSAE